MTFSRVCVYALSKPVTAYLLAPERVVLRHSVRYVSAASGESNLSSPVVSFVVRSRMPASWELTPQMCCAVPTNTGD
ncbi:hypothetical protein D3C85_1705060 [compost metagenome]